MSFLFEINSPLRSPQSISLAIEYVLGSHSLDKGQILNLKSECLRELEDSGQVSWEFIVDYLSSLVALEQIDVKIYQNLLDTKKRNGEAYKREGIFRHSLYWPNPTSQGGYSRFGILPIARQIQLFNKKTRIISIGSCFANEVTKRLVRDGYNYLKLESNSTCQTKHSFSANWGIVFNPLAFNQAIKYYFGLLERPPICWSSHHSGSLRIYDPFREDVTYSSLEEHNNDIHHHRIAGREALTQAEVIFLTLGLTEIWQLCSSKLALARAPYKINPLVGEH